MAVEDLVRFIKERHAVYLRKERGDPWPWTEDPILQKYRFCNVYRNLDRQSKLIQDNWLHPHNKDSDVWFAMVVARLVNWWPTLQEVGYPVLWNPAAFKWNMLARSARGEKIFTGAYMVRADAVISGYKADYLADFVLSPMWSERKYLRPKEGETLQSFHTRLMEFRDMGSFMAAQVVADVKYAEGSPLRRARDWETWAAPGPGSLRGLNRVNGDDRDRRWKPHEWEASFQLLLSEVWRTMEARKAPMPRISGQDLQNCLCEFDKYERVRLGQGRPRSMYHPLKENV